MQDSESGGSCRRAAELEDLSSEGLGGAPRLIAA